MDEEISLIRGQMTEIQHIELGGTTFVTGVIDTSVVVLLQSGIGKVNAAIGTTLLIREFEPRWVVNTGSAGALDPSLDIGDVVLGTTLVHHDADVTAFGYAPGQLPKMPQFFTSASWLVDLAGQGSNPGHLRQGLIASGDRFVNDPEDLARIKALFPHCLLVEMESAAIAQTCHALGTDYLVVRSVSDRANHEGAGDFKHNLHIAAENSAKIVLDLVRRAGNLPNKE